MSGKITKEKYRGKPTVASPRKKSKSGKKKKNGTGGEQSPEGGTLCQAKKTPKKIHTPAAS